MESYFNLLIDFRGHNPCLKTPGTAVIYARAAVTGLGLTEKAEKPAAAPRATELLRTNPCIVTEGVGVRLAGQPGLQCQHEALLILLQPPPYLPSVP